MIPFVERHQQEISDMLSCFGRVVITGTRSDICHAKAMAGYLGAHGMRLFDYTLLGRKLTSHSQGEPGNDVSTHIQGTRIVHHVGPANSKLCDKRIGNPSHPERPGRLGRGR